MGHLRERGPFWAFLGPSGPKPRLGLKFIFCFWLFKGQSGFLGPSGPVFGRRPKTSEAKIVLLGFFGLRPKRSYRPSAEGEGEKAFLGLFLFSRFARKFSALRAENEGRRLFLPLRGKSRASRGVKKEA